MLDTRQIRLGDVIEFSSKRYSGMLGAVRAFRGDDLEVRYAGGTVIVKRCRIERFAHWEDLTPGHWGARATAWSWEARSEWGLTPTE